MQKKLSCILAQTLSTVPWRLLLIIGRQRGLPLSANLSKDHLLERVGQILSEADSILGFYIDKKLSIRLW